MTAQFVISMNVRAETAPAGGILPGHIVYAICTLMRLSCVALRLAYCFTPI